MLFEDQGFDAGAGEQQPAIIPPGRPAINRSGDSSATRLTIAPFAHKGKMTHGEFSTSGLSDASSSSARGDRHSSLRANPDQTVIGFILIGMWWPARPGLGAMTGQQPGFTM